MHDDCKYSFYGKWIETKMVYDSLADKDIPKDITSYVPMCGFNPVAVKLITGQCICHSYEKRGVISK